MVRDEQQGPPNSKGFSLDRLRSSGFVGRRSEVEELESALEGAFSGKGRLVMLAGEAGIGKTRTAQELATHAEARDAQVMWGRCYEDQGTPPYWPWTQAIKAYVDQCDAESLTAEMGSGAWDIAEIVSEVRDRLPNLEPSTTLVDPESARFRLFDSVTTFLKNLSRAKPTVLVLDDLHSADRSSLALLTFLVRELSGAKLLVVGTYRDVELSRQHPLSETLAELSRESVFQRVQIRGLGQQEVGSFIEAVSGTKPARGLVEAVYSRTEGNSFFVTEMIRLLAQQGDLSREETGEPHIRAVRIPESVREVIGTRLNRLSQRCNQVLSTASVIGRGFGLDVLDYLIEELDEGSILEALEEALAGRVIEESSDVPGRYQFSHALIRETSVEELSTTRRVRLHSRIAQALEALYGAGTEAHAAEVVYHLVEARIVVGTEKLTWYCRVAGEQALDAYAYEEALEYFRQALGGREGYAVDAEMAGTLFGLGRTQAATLEQHRRREALDSLIRAFDYYAEVGDVVNAVAVAEYPLTLGYGDPGMAQLGKRALALVPSDSLEAGRLLCRYGLSLYLETGNYEAAQEALERALEIGRREKDATLELRALADAAHVDWDASRLEESVDKNLQAIELARILGDPAGEASAHAFAAPALMTMGELKASWTHTTAALEQFERLRDRAMVSTTLQAAQLASALEGNWRAA